MPLTLAIIGRPNVGKSTLFNRLTGKRHALVDDRPGVTRDRRYGQGHIGPIEFRLVDTAGLAKAAKESLESRMMEQTQAAIAEADLILFVIDGRAGVTPEDQHFARETRKAGKPVILLVNKAEGNAADQTMHEAHRLGFGEPIAISAEHAEGLAEVAEALVKYDNEEEESSNDGAIESSHLKLAILGRPNAGKSTLVNKLLGEERQLTGPEPGITRDSIALPFTWKGKEFELIDTAGLRKKANITEKLEKLAVSDALRALQFAHVAVLVLDAETPLEKQDLAIADLIAKEGRAIVIAANKWDLISKADQEEWVKAMQRRIEKVLPQIRSVPVIELSAKTGKNLDRLMQAALKMYEVWNREVSTAQLNRWLDYATQRHPAPLVKGRRINLQYMTQRKTRPPEFIIFANITSGLPESYERYIINGLRDSFDMPGVPIRITLRKKKNPYSTDK